MSRLMIQHHFGDEVISAGKLQHNFANAEAALNNINGDNFEPGSITNETLVGHMVSNMITFAPSTGKDVSWVGTKRLGWVTYGDWFVYKVGVWCSSNENNSTVQFMTSEPTYASSVTDLTRVGPKITPTIVSSNEPQSLVYSPVYGVVLKKGQALWLEQLLSDGTTGVSGDNTQGPIEQLRIGLYYRMPMRSA
jgi:hypothetical protein